MNRMTMGFCLALAGFAAGCSSSSTDDTTTGSKDAGVVLGDGATFTKVYDQVIKGYSCLDCHVPGKEGVTQGQLDLSTQAKAYADLVNIPAAGAACASSALIRVVPNDAKGSLIVQKTDTKTPPCGGQMPLGCGTDGGPPKCLGDDDLAPLESWINAGAQNN